VPWSMDSMYGSTMGFSRDWLISLEADLSFSTILDTGSWILGELVKNHPNR